MATRASLAIVLMAALTVACGSPATPAAATSPSPASGSDALTRTYVALVRGYWDGIVAADNATSSSNEAAQTCLGTTAPAAPDDINHVQPATCLVRARAILVVQEKFLADLRGTISPERFADDDKIFRRDVPTAIVAVKALIAAAATGSKQAVLDRARVYSEIMVTWVIAALDDVDPSTKHY